MRSLSMGQVYNKNTKALKDKLKEAKDKIYLFKYVHFLSIF